MKTTRRTKGFSMVELMVVVAILAVLLSVAGVAVVRHQRNLKRFEYDGLAKEIFLAAQGHISIADTQGLIPLSSEGTDDGSVREVDSTNMPADLTAKDGEIKSTHTYFIVHAAGDAITAGSALDQLLPESSLDETVRIGGNYVIRYDRLSARIRDVYYAEDNGAVKNIFSEIYSGTAENYSAYMKLLSIRGDDQVEKRMNYVYGDSKYIIGYYGGSNGAKEESATLEAPTLSVENGDELIAHVQSIHFSAGTVNVYGADGTPRRVDNSKINVALMVKGVTSGKTKRIELKNESGPLPSFVREVSSGYSYDVVLDSVTADKDGHFSTNFLSDGFYPGEDLTIYAVAYQSGSVGTASQSRSFQENSLFAGRASDGAAEISNQRHLQNLDPLISDMNLKKSGEGKVKALEISEARLQNSIDWNFRNVYDLNGNAYSHFFPLYNSGLKAFDGENYIISNLNVKGVDGLDKGAGSAGLFRLIDSDLKVSRLQLKDISVSDCTNAGAVAGEVSGGKVELNTVLARGNTEITGNNANSAGGLVGTYSGTADSLKVTNSAASLLVSGGNAGGLIGSIGGSGDVSLEQSYAGGHTVDGKYSLTDYNVTATAETGSAGGLVGLINNKNVSMRQCFSAASVGAAIEHVGAYAGGIFGCAEKQLKELYALYEIAPVQGVIATEDQDAVSPNRGAFAGAAKEGAASSLYLYYLPEVYEGSRIKVAPGSNVQKTGGSYVSIEGSTEKVWQETGVGLEGPDNQIQLAYYAKDTTTNFVSARRYQSTMSVNTKPYDSALGTGVGVQDYPFSVWSRFSFAGEASGLCYYGDWQPVNSADEQSYNVTFYYKVYYQTLETPATNVAVLKGGEQYFEVDDGADRFIIGGHDNELIIPTIQKYIELGEGTYALETPVTGVSVGEGDVCVRDDVDLWEIYAVNGEGEFVGENLNTADNASLSGNDKKVTLNYSICSGDLAMVATYRLAREEDAHALKFFYKDENGDSVQYGETQFVKSLLEFQTSAGWPVLEGGDDNAFLGWRLITGEVDEDGNPVPGPFVAVYDENTLSCVLASNGNPGDEGYDAANDYTLSEHYTLTENMYLEAAFKESEECEIVISFYAYEEAAGTSAPWDLVKLPTDEIALSGLEDGKSTVTLNVLREMQFKADVPIPIVSGYTAQYLIPGTPTASSTTEENYNYTGSEAGRTPASNGFVNLDVTPALDVAKLEYYVVYKKDSLNTNKVRVTFTYTHTSGKNGEKYVYSASESAIFTETFEGTSGTVNYKDYSIEGDVNSTTVIGQTFAEPPTGFSLKEENIDVTANPNVNTAGHESNGIHYFVILEYQRNKHTLTFDAAGGSPEPQSVELYYGQPLTEKIPVSTTANFPTSSYESYTDGLYSRNSYLHIQIGTDSWGATYTDPFSMTDIPNMISSKPDGWVSRIEYYKSGMFFGSWNDDGYIIVIGGMIYKYKGTPTFSVPGNVDPILTDNYVTTYFWNDADGHDVYGSTGTYAAYSPSKSGSFFRGWVVRDELGQLYYSNTDVTPTMPDADVTATAKWATYAGYTVIYWYENADYIDGTNGNDLRNYTYVGKETITADAKKAMAGDKLTGANVYNEFFVSSNSNDAVKNHSTFNENFGPNTEQVEIRGNGTSVVNVYLQRKVYTLTFRNSRGYTVFTKSGRYNQLITDIWPIVGTNGTTYSGYYWEDNGNPKTFQYILVTLDRIPKSNVTFDVGSNQNSGMIFYYLEKVPGQTNVGVNSPNNNIPTTTTFNGKEFYLYKYTQHPFRFLTVDEEFHSIEGFTVDVSYADPKGSSNSKRISLGDRLGSYPAVNYFYYPRNKYDIEYHVLDGLTFEELKTGTVSGVYYEQQIKDETNNSQRISEANLTTVTSNNLTGYTYATETSGKIQWYTSPGCDSGTEFYFNGSSKMPNGNLVLYTKYTPPKYSVTFNAAGGKTEGKDGATQISVTGATLGGGGTTLTRQVIRGSSLADDYTGVTEDGTWGSDYTPSYTDQNGYTYVFLYWAKQGGTNKYNPTETITQNVTLVPVWKDPPAATSTVTVKFARALYDADGKRTGTDDLDASTTITIEDVPVNRRWTVPSSRVSLPYIDGGLQYDTYSVEYPGGNEYLYVTANEATNVVTVVYEVKSSIAYTVSYVIRVGTGTNKQQVTLGTLSEESDTDYALVEFHMPASCGSYYRFLTADYGEIEDGSPKEEAVKKKTVNVKKNSEIIYYITPNPEAMRPGEATVMYDGAVHRQVNVPADEYAQSGLTAKWVYNYFGDNGSDPKDVGAYTASVSLVATVNGRDVTLRTYYSGENNYYYRILPRQVNLTSGDATVNYGQIAENTDSPVVDSGTGLGEGVSGDGFVPGEGITAYYNVDSFRRNPGKQENSFTYEFWENTKAINYQITTVFGMLEVIRSDVMFLPAASLATMTEKTLTLADGTTRTAYRCVVYMDGQRTEVLFSSRPSASLGNRFVTYGVSEAVLAEDEEGYTETVELFSANMESVSGDQIQPARVSTLRTETETVAQEDGSSVTTTSWLLDVAGTSDILLKQTRTTGTTTETVVDFPGLINLTGAGLDSVEDLTSEFTVAVQLNSDWSAAQYVYVTDYSHGILYLPANAVPEEDDELYIYDAWLDGAAVELRTEEVIASDLSGFLDYAALANGVTYGVSAYTGDLVMTGKTVAATGTDANGRAYVKFEGDDTQYIAASTTVVDLTGNNVNRLSALSGDYTVAVQLRADNSVQVIYVTGYQGILYLPAGSVPTETDGAYQYTAYLDGYSVYLNTEAVLDVSGFLEYDSYDIRSGIAEGLKAYAGDLTLDPLPVERVLIPGDGSVSLRANSTEYAAAGALVVDLCGSGITQADALSQDDTVAIQMDNSKSYARVIYVTAHQHNIIYLPENAQAVPGDDGTYSYPAYFDGVSGQLRVPAALDGMSGFLDYTVKNGGVSYGVAAYAGEYAVPAGKISSAEAADGSTSVTIGENPYTVPDSALTVNLTESGDIQLDVDSYVAFQLDEANPTIVKVVYFLPESSG